MTIKVEMKISEQALKKLTNTIQANQAEKIWALAVRAGPIMEREVVEIVKSEMFWDRAPRRRKAHTIKLVNSFVAVVDGRRGSLQVTSRLTLKRGVNAKKVAALEYGQREHEIPPGPKGLAFPKGEAGETHEARNAYGKNNYFTPRSVVHPAQPGYHMMRRARDHAVQLITL